MDFNEKIALIDQIVGAADRIKSGLATGNDDDYNAFVTAVQASNQTDRQEWPVPWSFDQFASPAAPRDAIIDNLIERSDVASVSGPSKSRKSFFLSYLALCMISGKNWYNFSIPKKLRVIYLNFELKATGYHRRLKNMIAKTMPDFQPEDLKNLNVFHLRGLDNTLDSVIINARNSIAKIDADIIIIDPLYKLLVGDSKRKIDENSASDMAYMISRINSLTTNGCAVLWSSHYTKAGGRAQMASMDRMAGSGVQSREPDCIMSLTELDTETGNDFKMEFTLRDFPPAEPLNFTWNHPIYEMNSSLASIKLKGVQGRNKVCSYEDIVACWNELRNGALEIPLKAMAERLGTSNKTIQRRIFEADKIKDGNPYELKNDRGIIKGKPPYEGSIAPEIPLELKTIPLDDAV